MAVFLMKFNKLVNINVCNAVAVSKHKRLIADIRLNTLYSAACHCIKAGIDNSNLPRLCMLAVNSHFIRCGKIKCNI